VFDLRAGSAALRRATTRAPRSRLCDANDAMATGDAMKMAINATIHGANIMASSPSPPNQAYADPHALTGSVRHTSGLPNGLRRATAVDAIEDIQPRSAIQTALHTDASTTDDCCGLPVDGAPPRWSASVLKWPRAAEDRETALSRSSA
jgi:hypothetical protein